MSKITQVITNVEYNEADSRRLINIFSPATVTFVHEENEEEIREVVKDCDVAYLKGNLTPKYYEDSDLKWVHCNIAGLDNSASKEVFEKGILLSGAAGRSAPALAEHAFFFLLNHVYSVKKTLAAQKNHQWGFPGIDGLESCYGKTIGIVGFGNTGKAVYEKAKAFGMKVVAYDKSPIGNQFELEKRYCSDNGDSMEGLLGESDFIVLSLSLSDTTYHIIDAKAFSLMKNTCFLINISRGSIVDEKAMIEALANHTIAGAGLDVTEIEPLQEESPLWEMDNVLLTPHHTARLSGFQ
jgi:phosphoglycerate dehydrogenase-like enzyme